MCCMSLIIKYADSAGEQDRKQYQELMSRASDAEHKSFYEAANEVDVGGDRRPPVSARIKTPDETKGVASSWVTVAVRDLPPKTEVLGK